MPKNRRPLSCLLIPVIAIGGPLVLSACFGSGGGSGDGDAAPPATTGGGTTGGGTTTGGSTVAYDIVTTAVLSGVTPDVAVGDGGVFLFTGTPPSTTAVAHPVLDHFAGTVVGGTANVVTPDGSPLALHFDSASQATLTANESIYNPSTGAKTGTNAYAESESLTVHVDPPSTGFFLAQITSVITAGDGFAVNDKLPILFGPNGQFAYDVPDYSTMVKSPSGWFVQGSGIESGVLNTRKWVFASTLASASFKHTSGATTVSEIAMSVAPLTSPTTITGGMVSTVAGAVYPGNAPGYATTAYVLAKRAAGSSLALVIHPSAGTLTTGSLVFKIFGIYQAAGSMGNFTLNGIRSFMDPSLTTADKRAWESVEVEYTSAGTFVRGITGFSLYLDPTPANNGGSLANDVDLGTVVLVP